MCSEGARRLMLVLQAEGNLARYGRALLDNLPDETTALLIDICTSIAPLPSDDESPPQSTRHSSTAAGPSYLSYLALSRGSGSVAPSDAVPPSSASTTTTVKPTDRVARRDVSAGTVSGSNTPPSRSATPTLSRPARPAPMKRPSPSLYFAHFIDHPHNFLQFLEAVAQRRWGQTISTPTSTDPAPALVEADALADPALEKRDQIAVWNTLLELYLSASPEETEKALALLRRDDLPFDRTHALILCSTRGFTSGLVLLWEKLGMYEDVVRFHIDREKEDPTSGASVEVVRCLERYGATRPRLYPLVLRFLTSTSQLLSKHTDDLGRILEHIEREKIMPPLAVVQVLSRNGVASVGLVKGWLLSRIKAAREEIEMVSPLAGCCLYVVRCLTYGSRCRTRS